MCVNLGKKRELHEVSVLANFHDIVFLSPQIHMCCLLYKAGEKITKIIFIEQGLKQYLVAFRQLSCENRSPPNCFSLTTQVSCGIESCIVQGILYL